MAAAGAVGLSGRPVAGAKDELRDHFPGIGGCGCTPGVRKPRNGRYSATRTSVTKYSVSPKQELGIQRCCS